MKVSSKLKYLIFISLLFTLLSNDIYSQNFYPLSVGDKWQFLSWYSDFDNDLNSIERVTISKDTLINGLKYFSVEEIGRLTKQTWQRFDTLSQKVYFNYNGMEYLYIDFSILNGGSFFSYRSPTYGLSYSVIRRTTTYFGQARLVFEMDCLSQNDKYTYADNNGYYYNLGTGAHSSDFGRALLCSVVKDPQGNILNWSLPDSATITHSPIPLISSSVNLKARFSNPNDCWNHIFGQTTLQELYTAKVGCEFYFVKDSLFSSTTEIIKTLTDTIAYFNFTIPKSYLTGGGQLRYRFKAINKQYIPDTTYSVWYMSNILTDVREDDKKSEKAFLANYPNPAVSSTQVAYYLPKQSDVTIKLFDILGNEIAIFEKGAKPKGNYKLEINTTKLSSGIYFLSLITETDRVVKKLVISN